jgi:hypothetical protein
MDALRAAACVRDDLVLERGALACVDRTAQETTTISFSTLGRDR